VRAVRTENVSLNHVKEEFLSVVIQDAVLNAVRVVRSVDLSAIMRVVAESNAEVMSAERVDITSEVRAIESAVKTTVSVEMALAHVKRDILSAERAMVSVCNAQVLTANLAHLEREFRELMTLQSVSIRFRNIYTLRKNS
jgi:hypothetical protein